MLSDFYKKNKNDEIWWIDDLDSIGKHLFSFDKEKIFNLFADYPHNLTAEQKEIFDKENPYWKDFLKEELNKIIKSKALRKLGAFLLQRKEVL